MKNIFIVLVLVASGYLLLTHKNVSEYVNTLMPNAQFKKLNDNLSTKIDGLISESLHRSLEDKIPGITQRLKKELEQSLTTLLDERVASSMLNSDIHSRTNIMNDKERVLARQSAQEKDAQINVLSNKLDDLSRLVTQLTHINTGIAESTKREVDTLNTEFVINANNNIHDINNIPYAGGNTNSHSMAEQETSKNEQQKITLQRITSEMNAQTLSLLVEHH